MKLLLAGMTILGAIHVAIGQEVKSPLIPKIKPHTEVIFSLPKPKETKGRKLFSEITKDVKHRDKKGPIFEKYLNQRFVPGTTTLENVIDLLGTPIDLDRPARDNVITYQWTVDGIFNVLDVHSWNVYIDFVPEEKGERRASKMKVLKVGASYAICGFCPHIFVNDQSGDWRLEGKLLAGCVGRQNSGVDTLVLPRLKGDRTCSVQFLNLAPEVEYIDKVSLARVALGAEEQLDVATNGDLVVWKPDFSIEKNDFFDRSIEVESTCQILTFELRNTSHFESVMRRHHLRSGKIPELMNVEVRFSNGERRLIKPVGTKFLRRVAIQIPSGAGSATLSGTASFWDIRRAWGGRQRASEPEEIQWTQALKPSPIVLHPNCAHTYRFSFEERISGKVGYAIRARGYYEFTFLNEP